MHNPDILKGSDIQITKSSDEYKISIPGYKIGYTIGGFVMLGFSFFALIILLNGASEIREFVIYSTVLVFIILSVIIMHSKTIIHFSKKNIKVRYGWLPFVRTRNTNNLNKLYIDYSEDGEFGKSFTHLVLSFSKEWKIIIDHLSRRERDFLIGRLSYLRYKFSPAEQDKA